MEKPKAEQQQSSEEFNNFQKAVKQFVAVPKTEIDKREAEWREKQQDKKAKRKTQ